MGRGKFGCPAPKLPKLTVGVHLEASERLKRKHDRCGAKRKALKHVKGLYGVCEEELEY